MLKFSVRGSAAALVLAAACGASRGNDEDPFSQYLQPGERVPLAAYERMLRSQEAYGKAETLFASGDYLAAAFEYDRVPYMHEAYDFGLLAEIVEHWLTALMLASPGLEYAVRFQYSQTDVRYLLVPESKPDVNSITVVLSEADGSRRKYTAKKNKKGRPILPPNWEVPRVQGEILRPREELESLLACYTDNDMSSTYQHNYGFARVETRIRASRVRERWLLAQGRSHEQVLAGYRERSLREPTKAGNGSTFPLPTLHLVMLADYCARHPKHRPELINVYLQCLLPRGGTAKIGLPTVVMVNRWVPVAVSAMELAASLEKALAREKDKKVEQTIHLMLAELHRYEAAASYWRAAKGRGESPEGHAYLLLPIPMGGRLRPFSIVPEKYEGGSVRELSRTRFWEVTGKDLPEVHPMAAQGAAQEATAEEPVIDGASRRPAPVETPSPPPDGAGEADD